MNKRIWIAALVLLVTVCLMLTTLAVVGGVVFMRSGGLFDQSNMEEMLPTIRAGFETEPPALQTPQPNQPTPEAGATDPSTGSDELPASVQAEMDAIEAEVSQLRGLPPISQPVTRDLMSPEELRQRVIDEFLADYTADEMQDDVKVLSAFGLLDKEYDLYSLYVDVYSEQIAGYYDDETREMYVIQGEEFAGPERMTYAHEFTHALQDAAYDLEDGLQLNEEYCEQDSEYCGAVTALIEGDASLTEQQWLLEHSSNEDKREILDFYEDYQSPVYDAAPAFLQADFLFPYQEGLGFVQSLYEQGGWQAVDAAYGDLPVSTEQILHPERYPDDRPVAVTLPALDEVVPGGWRELDRNVLGEWYLRLVLSTGYREEFQLSTSQASEAADGWGGDQYAVYLNEQDGVLLAFDSVWDDGGELDEFWDGFERYGERRWGRPTQQSSQQIAWDTTVDGAVVVQRSNDHVIWIIAPDRASADAALTAVTGS